MPGRSKKRPRSVFSGLPKILKWPGGKHLAVKKLVPLLPEHKVYVEPFAGGASIFFGKLPAKKNVINDRDCRLMGFYKGVAKGGLRRCSYVPNRKNFNRLDKKFHSGKKLTPCEYLALNKSTFSGGVGRGAGYSNLPVSKNRGALQVFRKLDGIEGLLKRTTITCGDFEKVMRRHDSKGTLHYLDPPYNTAVKAGVLRTLYPAGSASPAHVKKVAKAMKGKVVISYGDSPEIRKLFCGKGSGFKCYSMDMRYTITAHQDAGRRKREVVIANFDLKRGRRPRRRRKR